MASCAARTTWRARADLDAGLPVDLEDRFGFTAIYCAKSNGALLDLLLARGACVDQATYEGATPLMTAVQSRDLGASEPRALVVAADPTGAVPRSPQAAVVGPGS